MLSRPSAVVLKSRSHIIPKYDVSSGSKSGGATWPTSGANRVLPKRERKRRHQWRLSVREVCESVHQLHEISLCWGLAWGIFHPVLATGWPLSLETNGCQYHEICSNYFFDHFLPFIFFLLTLLLSLSLNLNLFFVFLIFCFYFPSLCLFLSFFF